MNFKTSFPLLFLALLTSAVLLFTRCAKENDLNQETAMRLDGVWRTTSMIRYGEELIPDRWIAIVLTFKYSAGAEGGYTFDFIGNQDLGRTSGRFEVASDGKKLMRNYMNSNGRQITDEYELLLNGKNLEMTNWRPTKPDSIRVQFTAVKQ